MTIRYSHLWYFDDVLCIKKQNKTKYFSECLYEGVFVKVGG